MPLNADACYAALIKRDRAFDGRFFVAVRTTGIYCRPICPARTPKRENCAFFAAATEAEAAGFVPCLRCRPDLAPGNAIVDAKAGLAARAARLIGHDVRIGFETLAARLGVTARHLRRALRDELGVSARELVQARRIAVATRLLRQSRLSITRIAFASGFNSIRRFNAAFRQAVGRAPSALRKASP